MGLIKLRYHLFFPVQGILLLLILGACSTSGKWRGGFGSDEDAYRIIENVPFYAQESYQCGPSAMAGVLNFYGKNVTPQQVGDEIFSKEFRGTLSIDMVFYARSRGLNAQWYSGDAEDLRKKIDGNQPLIAMVDLGAGPVQRPHYLVVVGYGPGSVIVNSGQRQHQSVSWKRFLKQWERTKMWTLLVHPETGS